MRAFRGYCGCCVHPQCVLCSRLRGRVHVIVPARASLTKRKVPLDPSALSGCEEKRGFSVSCPCVAGSESALCLAVREFATLRMKSWCRWLRQRVVCGRVECLLDSNRCRVSQWIPFTGGGSPISFLLVSIHCYWITIAFTAIGEGKGENRNSVPKRDVVIE